MDILNRLKPVGNYTAKITTTQLATGQNKFNASPAVSAFSDCIVISYPQVSSMPVESILWSLIKNISNIAALALEKGFLIRGGVSSGMLYHRDGIVFGPALVEASDYKNKLEIFNATISRNIEKFRKQNRLKELGKWQWISSYLQEINTA